MSAETIAPSRRDRSTAAERGRSRSWGPATIHRVADLSPRAQIAFAAIIVGLAVLPILSALVVLRQGWRPSGDNALIGLRVRDVLHGPIPLVGQPSTGENYGSGVESSHPGPLEFYAIAPFMAIFGPVVGLALGAAMINSAALVSIGWMAMRRGGMALMVIATVAATLYSRSLGGNFLHDPISSNVGALMALALMFSAWSIIAGDIRTLPLFVVIGSFTLQDHLSYLGTSTPVVLVAIGFGIAWIRRIYQRARNTDWLRPRLILSGVLGLVLWLPVMLDQFFGTGNLTKIFETFTSGQTEDPASKGVEGIGFASGRLAEALAPWPIFSRRVAPPLGWMHTPALHEVLLGYTVLIAVVVLGVIFFRRRRTDLATMVGVVLVAAGAGFYAATKLPSGAGVKAANLRWMWTVSAFTWIALAWLVWNLVPARWKTVINAPVAVLASIAIVVSLASVGGSIALSTDRDGTIARPTDELIAAVEQELPEGTYRVRFQGSAVALSVGPAIFHDLEVRGDDLYLDMPGYNRAYGDHRTYADQAIEGTILITAGDDQSYPQGNRLLARQSLRVNRNDADRTTVRVFLVEGAG